MHFDTNTHYCCAMCCRIVQIGMCPFVVSLAIDHAQSVPTFHVEPYGTFHVEAI
jgi:hypothetical protein